MGAEHAEQKLSQLRKSTSLRYLFELDDISGAMILPAPSTDSEDIAEANELISVINSCSTRVFTFTDVAELPAEQELKTEKLTIILNAIRAKKPLKDEIVSPLLAMIAGNLFRALPPPAYPLLPLDLFEEDGPMFSLAPSWPHLCVVYDILAALVNKLDAKKLRKSISHSFLQSLVELFQSEDPREREKLKTVYHQVYAKLPSERLFMRKSMGNVLLDFVFDMEKHCGIGELLEIWGSIINGFALPLKDEHRLFLVRVLLPLHRHKGISAYQRQLTYCVVQFVVKEPELGEVVVKEILRHWPVTNSQKEMLLIGELEDLFEHLSDGVFERLIVPVCSLIVRCSNSSNSQVAERALYLWNNERFLATASRTWEQVLPSVVASIEKNLKCHWSKSVHQITLSVKTLLEAMEPKLYAKFLQELDKKESSIIPEQEKRKQKWEMLEMSTDVISGNDEQLV